MNTTKKNERISAIIGIITQKPGVIFPYKFFDNKFGVAKSTISEDSNFVKQLFQSSGIGRVETVVGASGGIRFIPETNAEEAKAFVAGLCEELSDPTRVLPGNFIFTTDILFNPAKTQQAGEILASRFREFAPDCIMTIETGGIQLASMTARALNCPLIVARREHKIMEGPIVTINYLSQSGNKIQTMSISKRAMNGGKRVLIIDDFMKGGGSASGMISLIKEFDAELVGIGVLISTAEPVTKKVQDYTSLMTFKGIDRESGRAVIEPSDWIKGL